MSLSATISCGAALALLPVLCAQTPQFTIPRQLLTPGGILAIYGSNLGPIACSEAIPQNGPYPLEVCGVRVTAGGAPAGLMYVGDHQINLKLPQGLADGPAAVVVYSGDQRSEPVMAEFSTHTAYLHLAEPAYLHMPLWIEMELPQPYRSGYPCGMDPWDFRSASWSAGELDDFEIQVRQNGVLLTPAAKKVLAPGSSLPACMGGFGVASRQSSLPLHLAYRIESPGTYAVKLTVRRAGEARIAVESAWTDITVKAAPPGARSAWLGEMADKIKTAIKTASLGELISDVIPSLLAWPDDQALAALLPLYEDWLQQRSCSNQGCFAAGYIRNSVAAFDDATIRRVIPAARRRALGLAGALQQ